MLCSKLHCYHVLKFELFSYKIEIRDGGEDARLAQAAGARRHFEVQGLGTPCPDSEGADGLIRSAQTVVRSAW